MPEPAKTWSREVSFNENVAALPPPSSFVADAASLGLEFDPGDVDRLGRYLALLLEANRAFNLTAVDDPGQAWARHILDSLSLLPTLAELPDGAHVIDVGSGGGLPGVPLAICLPRLRFTLLEATGKKAEFLRRVAAALRLSNVTVEHARAEDAGSHGRPMREAFQAVVARAVGPLATLVEITSPFCRVGGRLLLIKGQKADDELSAAERALELLNLEHAGTIDTPSGRIVAIDKTDRTPRKYPRAAGEPKRRPLGGGPDGGRAGLTP
ncbi:MAG: 16S rRNA (guanine(527)-N(7))-methyltransferase RsmG [Phycisphaerales bacterium]|nr:16S rRNA (guanine(527)-N(7))-methyltransferase RsmG [Phycisphaerales bacterium]